MILTHGVDENTPILYNAQPYLEKKRWLMVIIFATQAMTNSIIWITFGPVTKEAGAYFNVVSSFILIFI
jgi:hypothetical protein